MATSIRFWCVTALLSLMTTGILAQESTENAIDDGEDLPILLERAERDTHKGWGSGDYFKMQERNGRQIYLDPNGEPFYSIGMVYAYGPEMGLKTTKLTAEIVISELEAMKEHGFNTLDLYGNAFIDEVLDWCQENKMGVYLRTSYTDGLNLNPLRNEFPDFMDPEFRAKAIERMVGIAVGVQEYHSVLAIDMDQRWLFGVDWRGQNRLERVHVGPSGVRHFPIWLENKYKDIVKLNTAWEKKYNSFSDILEDQDITRNGRNFESLDRKAWRLDIVEYALWTINDFQKELNTAVKEVSPNILLTYTTELPEVIPFPISTKLNSGIDFISPVHYNYFMDYDRDWASNVKLIMQTKFHADLSGLSTYVNETGFRTNTLHQRPPVVSYAMTRQDDQEQKAELYLEQMSLSNVMPWMLGWSYFKWFDKWPEGDFGYVESNGSLRPISDLGMKINKQFAINWSSEPPEKVVLFYPTYTLAAPHAGFQQFKGLISFLENTLLVHHRNMVKDVIKLWRSQADIKEHDLFKNLKAIFEKEWFPFRFVSDISNVEKPILLAGYNLEMLSDEDRTLLNKKKTISFGPVGLYDERFHKRDPWYLEVVGIDKSAYEEKIYTQDIGVAQETETIESLYGKISFLMPGLKDSNRAHLLSQGQKIKIRDGVYTSLELLMCANDGDVTDIVGLVYDDGTVEDKYIAPTVNDWRFKPTFNHLGWTGIVADKKEGNLSHISIPVNASKRLVALQLPTNQGLWLFAVSMIEGGVSSQSKVRLHWEKSSVEGTTPWLLSVRPGSGNYQTLAVFENGWPAVIKSNDGQHIAFLYDALTWRDGAQEISLQTLFHEKLIRKLVEDFE
ncbi:MAG: beta-galactosidase [Chlamydiota bacterium]|nr:beta-galactosidase [Chlamydiota bacterium]